MKTGLDFFSGTPLLKGLSGLLISPSKGFFYYSPVAILYFFSFRSFMKKHRSVSLAFLLIIIAYLLMLSKNIYWHGDWAWGPRYLLVITPFFLIPAAQLFDAQQLQRRHYFTILIYTVFFVSLLIQLAAISVNFQRYFFKLMYEEKVIFNVSIGDGVQRITEPPPEIYFNWKYSPIIYQIVSIYDIGKGLRYYKYYSPPDNANISEKLRASASHNLFDFWWLYRYYLEKSYSGFLAALLLLLFAIYTSRRLHILLDR
jgi:hypothetical protein